MRSIIIATIAGLALGFTSTDTAATSHAGACTSSDRAAHCQTFTLKLSGQQVCICPTLTTPKPND